MQRRQHAGHSSVLINGPKLREIRKRRGHTASSLARALGVSCSYVAAIERGDRPTVPPSRYLSICAQLAVDYDDLLAGAAA